MTDKLTNTARQIRRIVLVAVCLLLLCDITVTLYKNINGAGPLPQILELLLPGLAVLLIFSELISNRQQHLSGLTSIGNFNDHLEQSAIVVDNRCIIRNANMAAVLSVSKTPAELVGQAIHTWFHPTNHDDTECPICQHIKAGKAMPATDFAFPNQTWQQISLTRLSTHNDSPLIQFHIDITPRKELEEQLALVINGAELGYWDWHYLSGKHSVNQRWLEMLGLSQDDLDQTVSDWDKRVHPDDRQRVQELVTKHIESGRPYVVEFRMRHKLGHWVWIQGSGAVVAHDPISGKPSRLCGTHQDISVRKQSEHNLQRAYQIISQSAAVVLKWNNSDGLPIEFATENARQLFGYSVEQLITGNLFYLNLVHPDDSGVFLREIGTCRNDPDCCEIVHQPYRIVTQNGGIKWVQDRKMVVRNEQGRIIDYQGLVTDITQQRQQSSVIRNIVSSNLPQNATSLLDNLTLLTLETLGADYAMIAEVLDDKRARSLSLCANGKIIANREFSLQDSPCQELASGTIRYYERDVAAQFPAASWLRLKQVEGYLGIPLLDKQQNSFGFISVSYCRPRLCKNVE
ncbi:PAS domain-containing protein [Methylomonas albis]|uniref:PAS domain-containing protein n=1 Tax=Methylomonas albis TaxID=1854563 RepID=UPI001CE210E1|nr:PAS domain-containing protein [Methylomonas albis]